MTEPFIGEISLFPYDFIPQGWAPCNGALLKVQQNQALFALIGATFGGDGKTNFRLPDLRGRAVVGQGSNGQGTALALGTYDGLEQVVLTEANLPAHTHLFTASGATGAAGALNGNYLAKAQATPTAGPAMNLYTSRDRTAASLIPLNPDSVGYTGGVSQTSRSRRRHGHHDRHPEHESQLAAPSEALHGHRPPVGGPTAQGHHNMQPFLALAYCIALQGYFPPNPNQARHPDGSPSSDPDGGSPSPAWPGGSPTIETE